MTEPLAIEITGLRRIENEPYILVSVKISSKSRSEKRVLTVPDAETAKLGLRRGPIDETLFEKLSEYDMQCSAYRKGMNILNYGRNSEKRLVSKLRSKGIDKAHAEEAAAMLKAEGYINEEADVAGEIGICLHKLWGERRIIAKLYEKGYSDNAVNLAKDELSDVDFTQNCIELIKKKYGQSIHFDRSSADKATAFLIRYGYSVSEIRAAIKKASEH